MPDVSIMPELCEELSISTNELLAGERLESIESFNQKAEETIMELMKHNEKANAKLRRSLVGGLVGMILLFLYIMSMGELRGYNLIFFADLPSACCVAGITILVLFAAGKLHTFISGIRMCFRRSPMEAASQGEILAEKKAAAAAISTAIVANVLGGMFGTATALIYILAQLNTLETIVRNAGVALLTVFYGILFALVLLPFRERLRG